MIDSERSEDNNQSDPTLSSGTIVSHYRIVTKIGAGGMGEVYLADDSELERQVALKFLPVHLIKDEDIVARFKREAQATAKLNHPNVITVFEVGEHEGRPFFAMEYAKGLSLRDAIKEEKLHAEDAISIASQLCEGLQAAHSAGIIHRDIKPHNIMLAEDGRAKILDFGLAHVAGKEKLTKTGSTLGTMGYMSPEQIQGKQADERSDLFSLGVVLYEMITGRLPFDAEHEAAIHYNIVHEDPEPVSRYKSGVSAEIQLFVDKALAKDPSLRYQHADSMLSDLRRLSVAPARKPNRQKLKVPIAVIVVLSAIYLAVTNFLIPSKATSGRWTNSIAVMVFRDLSPGGDQAQFCEGMTDAINSRLSQIKNLKVISLTSVLKIKESDEDIRKIGELLGVENILEGSILRENNKIRVRAHLLDVNESAQLWSDQFDETLESIFDVQDDMSKAIVDALQIELMSEEEENLGRRSTNNVEAYNEYTQGRYFWRKRTAEGMEKSIEHFKRAIGLDSSFALAYSGLADALATSWGYSNVDYSDVEAQHLEAAKKAIQLDSNLAETRTSMAFAYWNALIDIEKAESEFKMAMELNPCYSWARIWYGNMVVQWWKDSATLKEELIKALECDPLSIIALINLADLYSNEGKFKGADSLFDKIWEIEPTNAVLRVTATRHYLRAGDLETADKLFVEATSLEPTTWDLYYGYAASLFSFDYKEEAEKVWSLAISRYPDQADLFKSHGFFLKDSTRQYDKSIEQFRKAVALNEGFHIAYRGLAEAYDAAKEFQKAKEAAHKALSLYPEEPQPLVVLGQIYYHTGELDSSLYYSMEFLKQNPGHMREVVYTGNRALMAQQYDLSDSLFDVLSNHVVPRSRANGRLFRYRVLAYQGKLEEALSSLAIGIALDEQEYPYRTQHLQKAYIRGLIFLVTEDFDSAMVQFQKARQIAKKMESSGGWGPIVENRIAMAYAYKGERDRADEILGRLTDTVSATDTSGIARSLLWTANTLYASGQYDSAAVMLERRGQLRGFNSAIRRTLGNCYYHMGRHAEAIEMLKKALPGYNRVWWQYPHRFILAHYELGRAYEADGQIDNAIEQYEIFLDIWKNADEGLKSVQDAKARLARIRSEELR